MFGMLHYACKASNTQLVQELLDLNCSPTLVSETKKTPLHFAAELGHVGQVQLLLEYKAALDCQMVTDFATPLILAVKGKHYECVQVLLEAGANPNQASNYVSADADPKRDR